MFAVCCPTGDSTSQGDIFTNIHFFMRVSSQLARGTHFQAHSSPSLCCVIGNYIYLILFPQEPQGRVVPGACLKGVIYKGSNARSAPNLLFLVLGSCLFVCFWVFFLLLLFWRCLISPALRQGPAWGAAGFRQASLRARP